MSAIKKRTEIKLLRAMDLAKSREKWKKLAYSVGADVRPTRIKKMWNV